MKVLAVGAHPDDIEILCAGTLFKMKNDGQEVEIAVATDGSAGWKEQDYMLKTRKKEAEEAADFLGAKLYWMGFKDEFLFSENKETRLAFIELFRESKPDIVLTHYPGDYHPDHRAVSKLVFDATFVASVRNIKTKSPHHTKVPSLFYFDTLAGLGFEPQIYIDITPFFENKKRMLSFHKSQLEWLKIHDNIDILYFMETVARFRGIQFGVEFAEGFIQERVWPRINQKDTLIKV